MQHLALQHFHLPSPSYNQYLFHYSMPGRGGGRLTSCTSMNILHFCIFKSFLSNMHENGGSLCAKTEKPWPFSMWEGNRLSGGRQWEAVSYISSNWQWLGAMGVSLSRQTLPLASLPYPTLPPLLSVLCCSPAFAHMARGPHVVSAAASCCSAASCL